VWTQVTRHERDACLARIIHVFEDRKNFPWDTIFHALARQKECQILEVYLLPDHVHMCIAIPPKHPVASVIRFLKGKSAIAIARLCGNEQNFTGEHFWARRYAVSTVGFELEQIRPYIRDQEEADGSGGPFCLPN
jgi:putative transposase